jgi:hypothetical protein
MSVKELFENTNIYLFNQILNGRFNVDMRILNVC